MGIVALVGLLAQKKSVDKVISGTVKTVAGFLIMSTGAGMISQTVRPIGSILEHVAGLDVTPPGMGQEAFIGEYGGNHYYDHGLWFSPERSSGQVYPV